VSTSRSQAPVGWWLRLPCVCGSCGSGSPEHAPSLAVAEADHEPSRRDRSESRTYAASLMATPTRALRRVMTYHRVCLLRQHAGSTQGQQCRPRMPEPVRVDLAQIISAATGERRQPAMRSAGDIDPFSIGKKSHTADTAVACCENRQHHAGTRRVQQVDHVRSRQATNRVPGCAPRSARGRSRPARASRRRLRCTHADAHRQTISRGVGQGLRGLPRQAPQSRFTRPWLRTRRCGSPGCRCSLRRRRARMRSRCSSGPRTRRGSTRTALALPVLARCRTMSS
jgi:hypothetical protein